MQNFCPLYEQISRGVAGISHWQKFYRIAEIIKKNIINREFKGFRFDKQEFGQC